MKKGRIFGGTPYVPKRNKLEAQSFTDPDEFLNIKFSKNVQESKNSPRRGRISSYNSRGRNGLHKNFSPQESSRDNSVNRSKKAMTGWGHPNNPPPDSNPFLPKSIKTKKKG
jgi:hypothetical protein